MRGARWVPSGRIRAGGLFPLIKMDYTLRVDSLDEKLVQYIKSVSTTWIYCIEKIEDNPHMHWVLQLTVGHQTLRNFLKKMGLQGNKSYSLVKVRDLLKSVAYVTKDGRYFYSDDFPPELLEDAKEYDSQVKEDMKKKKLKQIPRYVEELKKLNLTTINEITAYVIQDYLQQYKTVTYSTTNLIRTLCLILVPHYKNEYVTKVVGDLLLGQAFRDSKNEKIFSLFNNKCLITGDAVTDEDDTEENAILRIGQ